MFERLPGAPVSDLTLDNNILLHDAFSRKIGALEKFAGPSMHNYILIATIDQNKCTSSYRVIRAANKSSRYHFLLKELHYSFTFSVLPNCAREQHG